MTTILTHSAHSVGESNLHLQFTPAYRRDVFRNTELRDLVTILLTEQATRLRIVIAALDYGPDHVHLFVTNWKNWSIPQLAQRLKGVVSRVVRQHYAHLFRDKLWGKKFWSAGYFYRTVGVVTAETVKQYVKQSQRKHWREEPVKQQHTLLSYH